MPRAIKNRRAKASKKTKESSGPQLSFIFASFVVILFIFVLTFLVSYSDFYRVDYSQASDEGVGLQEKLRSLVSPEPTLDKDLYDTKLMKLANHKVVIEATSTATSTISKTASSTEFKLWPVKAVYPNPGAILPFKRIVAYYGNFYSKGMGVLGEYPKDVMISKLRAEVERWNKIDPETPVLPAIDYIATTAQESPGKQGLYMLRMPDSEIDKALELAHEVDGIVILDIQVGLSTLPKELPLLEKYLKMPEVHLAIDPEFSMKTGARPGTVVGTFDASDINYAADYLAKLVRENDLPPKVLIVHRFTQNMVTGYKRIKPLPEVQIVMDMDGWGSPAKKINTYRTVIYPEPVQFTGFKLFYKNDLKAPSPRIMTPEDLMNLEPRPIFIQYQ